jgi:hypothetical protein
MLWKIQVQRIQFLEGTYNTFVFIISKLYYDMESMVSHMDVIFALNSYIVNGDTKPN